MKHLKPCFAFFLADLKKTLAVLLDNIMLRLGKLEAKVENIYNGTGGNLTNGTSTITPSATNSEKVNVAGIYCIFFFFFCCSSLEYTRMCMMWRGKMCPNSGFVYIFGLRQKYRPRKYERAVSVQTLGIRWKAFFL